MKVWITKYALSSGVFVADAAPETEDRIVLSYGPIWHHYRKPDWHETEAAAKTRVLEMLCAKEDSLLTQLVKLNAIGVALVVKNQLPMAQKGSICE